jgi:hypothetical protein
VVIPRTPPSRQSGADQGSGHPKTSEVGEVLERAVRRIERHLDRRGLLGTRENDLDLSGEGDPECNLATSAVPQRQAARSAFGEAEAAISIRDGLVLWGSLPRRAMAHVEEWRAANVDQLLGDWERARNREPLQPIQPLE